MSPTLNAFLSSTLCSAFNKAHHLSPLSPLSHLTHLSHIGHLGLVLFFLMLAELQGQGGSEGSSRTFPRLISHTFPILHFSNLTLFQHYALSFLHYEKM